MTWTSIRRSFNTGWWVALRKALLYLTVAAAQVAVFELTPIANRFYDGWPRGWLVLSVPLLAAFIGGLGPGLAALAAGVALIWWRGLYFVPMHPGLEVFATIGLVQILLTHRLQLAKRELLRRQEALELERNNAFRSYELARQADRAKDDFMAVLSHELRTPLNVILGYSRMLHGRSDLPDFARRAVDVILRNAMSQIRLVEDLLDVQRFRKSMTLERGRCDLHALAASVMESLQPAAAAKRLHCAVHVERVTIEGDPARIQQVLWNLLSNAIKFTPEEGCIVLSGVRAGDHAVVTVEDSGLGIPPHFLPHVFEPFRQLDMSSTRRHGGLGLGLAIVKNIVEAHGGTVAAHSEGQGSRFTLRLPLTLPPQASGAAGEERVA